MTGRWWAQMFNPPSSLFLLHPLDFCPTLYRFPYAAKGDDNDDDPIPTRPAVSPTSTACLKRKEKRIEKLKRA